jgi:hypothetical protein
MAGFRWRRRRGDVWPRVTVATPPPWHLDRPVEVLEGDGGIGLYDAATQPARFFDEQQPVS